MLGIAKTSSYPFIRKKYIVGNLILLKHSEDQLRDYFSSTEVVGAPREATSVQDLLMLH